MSAGAQLTVTDKRRAARHPVDFTVIAEHRRLGDLPLHIINVSAQGFMAQSSTTPGSTTPDSTAPGPTTPGDVDLERGERLVMRLPVIGRIEAHMIWSHEGRAGFQFERIIRMDDFLQLVDTLQPNPRLRPRR